MEGELQPNGGLCGVATATSVNPSARTRLDETGQQEGHPGADGGLVGTGELGQWTGLRISNETRRGHGGELGATRRQLGFQAVCRGGSGPPAGRRHIARKCRQHLLVPQVLAPGLELFRCPTQALAKLRA